MKAISDSSPLITLAKIRRIDLLPQLYGTVTVTPEVYTEVVVTGPDLAGSAQVRAANWIELKPVIEPATLHLTQRRTGLGIGELSVIQLGRELKADVLLIDDKKARKLASHQGLPVVGCVGVLYNAFTRNLMSDLSESFRQLLNSGAYIDRPLLAKILDSLNLPPL